MESEPHFSRATALRALRDHLGLSRSTYSLPSRWSYSCCITRANQPLASNATGSPFSSWPAMRTHSARLSGHAWPGTDRQPSASSSGSGATSEIFPVVSTGLTRVPRGATPSSFSKR